MWSYIALTVLLLHGETVVDAQQVFPGEGCSICPTTRPVVGLPDVILPGGFAGVLDQDQTCAETEALAQNGAYSQGSCVLLRVSGITDLCGCEEAGAPVSAPVAVPTRRPVRPPTTPPEPAPTDKPVAPPTDAPIPAATDPPTPAPTDAPVPLPTDVPVASPSAAPVVVVAPPASPVVVAVPTLAPTPNATTPSSVAPTATPVASNVTLPPSATVVPTPTKVPTTVTTPAPVPVDLTETSGQVNIRLDSTSGPLTDSTTATFIATCSAFYSKYLPVNATNVTCSLATPTRRLTETKRSFHLRATQAVNILDILTNVTAFFDISAGVIPFESELVKAVNSNAEVFAYGLKTGGDTASQEFYQGVTTVTAFDPQSIPSLAPVVATPPSPGVPTSPVAPSTPTAATPAAAPVEKDDNKLSTGQIVGIVVGVAAGVALFVGLIALAQKSNPSPATRPIHTDPVGEDFPAPNTIPSVKTPVVASSFAKEPTPMPPAAVAATTAAAVGATAAAAAMGTKDPDGNKDGMSVMTGSEMDAYSLDPGNVDQPSSAPGTKRDTIDGMSQSGDEMSSHAMSSLRQNMVSRTVIAPPGKLGIVIDTTLEGPVVHKINPQSPLEGTLFPGDIIVAIDDVDTRAMSASAITALMVRTANLRRKLTVLSEDVTN
jgi:hypothetical protein